MMKSENGEHCFGVQYQHSGAPVYVCTLYCVHAVLTGQVCLEDVYIDIYVEVRYNCVTVLSICLH